MELTEKEVKRIGVILLIAILAVLTFFIIRPVLLSIIGGLILAYAFFPFYKWVLKYVKYESLAAALVSFFIVAIVFIPIWFLAPSLIERIFNLFQTVRNLDIRGAIVNLLPNISPQVLEQIVISTDGAIAKITSTILNSLVELLVNFAPIFLNLLLVAFVFFFALKDEKKLKEFVSGLSPLNKTQEKVLIQQFKDITNSIVYGQIIVGIFQGIVAGIGFFIFGVPNALLLTALSILFGIVPVIGPGLVYLPVAIYLLLNSSPIIAIAFLVYNLVLVSTVDNVLRAHLVSRKTKISQVIVLIGMLGGFLIFGILGLVIGPLIVAYFLTFLKAYKERNLSSLFAS